MSSPAPAWDCQAWPVHPQCLPDGWQVDPEDWPQDQRVAMTMASDWLHRATAGHYGACLVRVRPCRPQDGPCPAPVLVGGVPVLTAALGCPCPASRSCTCAPRCEVALPGPIASIMQVRVDGEVVPETAYRVDNGRHLVRTDGQCWPTCQDLNLPDTSPGTWSVLYWQGTEIPPLGRMAVTLLAKEFALLCSGDQACALPQNVVSLSRQGVSYEFAVEPGATNIKLVDDWISLANPAGLAEELQIYSVDITPPRVQTWPTGEASLPQATAMPASSAFTWQQIYASSTWTIRHNLGYQPAGVRAESAAGQEIIGQVTYPNTNTVVIEFNWPLTGVAYLS